MRASGPLTCKVKLASNPTSMTGKQPKRLAREGVDQYGRTPLHGAVVAHNLDAVQSLLKEGENADAQDDNGLDTSAFRCAGPP